MIIEDGGELDGAWWFLIEDATLDPETPRWTFRNGVAFDSSRPDAQGFYYPTGSALVIVFPSSTPGHSHFIATVTKPPVAVDGVPTIDQARDPNFLSGNFTQTIDGFEHSDPCALWRDGPWLDDVKRERAAHRAPRSRAAEQEAGAAPPSPSRLHRPSDDADPAHYPLTRIVIEIQAPHAASIETLLGELDEISDRLRQGETEFAAEALFGYRVTVNQADADMFGAPIAADPATDKSPQG